MFFLDGYGLLRSRRVFPCVPTCSHGFPSADPAPVCCDVMRVYEGGLLPIWGQQSSFGQLIHYAIGIGLLEWGFRWPEHFAFVDFKSLKRQDLFQCQGRPPLLTVVVYLSKHSISNRYLLSHTLYLLLWIVLGPWYMILLILTVYECIWYDDSMDHQKSS